MASYRAALIAAIVLLAGPAAAQTVCPAKQTEPGFHTGGAVFGFVASQWNAFFGAKVDGTNGCSTNTTLVNPLIVGGAFSNFTFTPPIVVSSNALPLPTPISGTQIQIGGADGQASTYESRSFGGSTGFIGVRTDGTSATPTGLISGDVISFLGSRGYDGSGYSANPDASLRGKAAGTWSNSSHPTEITFGTTAAASTTMGERWHVGPSGGLWSAGATGTDEGADTLNTNAVYIGGTGMLGTTKTANTVLAGPVSGSAAAPAYRVIASNDLPTSQYGGVTNCGIEVAVNSNNVSFTLTDVAGGALSATNPCTLVVGTPTANPEPLPLKWAITANQTVTLNSGSTLGTSNGVPFRVWIQMGMDGIVSTPQLVVSVQSNTSTPTAGVAALGVEATTVCSSCASATALQTYYGNTAMALGTYYRTMGFAQWGSGLATAGVWSALPSLVAMVTPGIPLPGQPTGNIALAQSTANATAGSTTPVSSGLQVQIGSALNPISPTNLIRVRAQGNCKVLAGATGDYCTAQISSGVGPTLIGSNGGPVMTTAAAAITGGMSMEAWDGPAAILKLYRVYFWGSATSSSNFLWNPDGLTTQIVAEEIEG